MKIDYNIPIAVEHRELRRPVMLRRGAPVSREFVDNLVQNTPPGEVLRADEYTYRLPEDGKVAKVRVLRNGHGLLRTGDNTEEPATIRERRPYFISFGRNEAVVDGVPGRGEWVQVKHLFVHTHGDSPRRTTPRAALQAGNRLS